MRAVMVVLAVVWPLTHLALVAFLIVGGPLSVRRSTLARVHLVAAAATGTVFLLGADCPLTIWEKSARRAAGWPSYRGGFIEHYLIRPVHPAGITPLITVAIVATWVLPTLAAHVLRLRQPSAMTSNVWPHRTCGRRTRARRPESGTTGLW